MGFARIFDNVWSGARHALVGPSQVDRFGQTNIAALGGTYEAPKVQLLGEGFPATQLAMQTRFSCPSIPRVSSLRVSAMWFAPSAITPSVCKGYSFDDIDIRGHYGLCVMDFNGPNKQMRVISLHPASLSLRSRKTPDLSLPYRMNSERRQHRPMSSCRLFRSWIH